MERDTSKNPLSEKYPNAQVVLATDNSFMIAAFREEYGDPLSNINPESVNDRKEPTSGAVQAVLFKIREVSGVVESDDESTVIVVGADVEFRKGGKKRHRKERDGKLSDSDKDRLKEKAIRWYKDPFEAAWKVALAIQVMQKQNVVKRGLVKLNIDTNFPDGVPEQVVLEHFNLGSNALINLAEAGAEGRGAFSVSHPLDQRKIPIAQERVVPMVRSKILPSAMIRKMVDGHADTTLTDELNVKWGIFNFSLIQFFGENQAI